MLTDDDKQWIATQLREFRQEFAEGLAQNRQELAVRLEQNRQEFVDRLERNSQKFADRMEQNRQEFADRLEQNRQEFAERLERVETTLLTEFHKWSSPVEMRMRSHSTTLQALDLELEALKDRVSKLEGKKAS
jgi:DNA anti-recombination protein RmuC